LFLKVRRIALMVVLHLIAVIRLHRPPEKKDTRITDLLLACTMMAGHQHAVHLIICTDH